MYNPSSQKNKDYKMNEITNNSPKRGFFRSSLRSKEDLLFLKNRDESHRYVRDTLTKPDLSKYVSQTTKNQQQGGKYFKNKQIKDKSYTSITGNRSLDKNFLKNQHATIDKKPLRENIKPQSNEYQKLHDKLNYLQGKISEMKNNLQKKRQEKKRYFDRELQEKKQREERDKISQNYKEKEKEKEKEGKKWKQSLKDLVTQVPYHKELKTFDFNPYSPRHNVYYVAQIIKAYKQEKSLARQHLLNSIHLLKMLGRSRMPSRQEISQKCVNLQRKFPEKKTVIFDLDETLIHCNENTNVPYDIKLPIKFPTGETIQAGINIRPYAKQIIKNLSKNFQIIVFTASHSCYANVVLNYLDPQNKYISHRLFREHCYATSDGIYVKDLRVINREMSQMVLVDNAAYSYAFQVDNGIPILPYYEGKHDYELRALQNYIQTSLFSRDVRQSNRNTFKIHKYVEFDNCQTLVKELYGQFLR